MDHIQTDSEHLHRLLDGMANAVAASGYAATTIADIVRLAGVSRRTFYEHFSTKQECFIALYEAASLNALKVLRNAIDPAHDWHTQLERAMSAYLGSLAQNPVLMRTLFIEILGLGEEGLAARRRINEEIVAFMLKVVNGQQSSHGPGKQQPQQQQQPAVLSPDIAMALVGGINELVLQAIERKRVDNLQDIVAPALLLIGAVT
ncbi:TetR/AcrR family transcriptional regulator [Undibacterium sp. TJN25]|uniref:TetR/AcrR family transcriptional regulator n=1 Tax=Undibacterium sp. TJN25 TaxID=3413056 RepID=UPI003BEF81FA